MTELDKITTEVPPSSLQRTSLPPARNLDNFKKHIEDFFNFSDEEVKRFKEGCLTSQDKQTNKLLLDVIIDVLEKSKPPPTVSDIKQDEVLYNLNKKILKDMSFGLFNVLNSYNVNDRELKIFLLGKLVQSLYGR